MSLATLLLALAPAIFRPKLKPEKSDPRFIAGYNAGLKDGRRESAELEGELRLARRDLDVMRTELDRAWAERDSWRQRYEELRGLGSSDYAAMQLAQYHQAAQQMNQAQQNQLAGQQQLAAQNAMAFGHGQMLGAQAIAAADFWCNCVPARHDMLLRR